MVAEAGDVAGVLIMEEVVVILVGTVATIEDITEDTQITMELDIAVKESKPFLTIVVELISLITTIVRVGMVHNNFRRTMDENNYFRFGRICRVRQPVKLAYCLEKFGF